MRTSPQPHGSANATTSPARFLSPFIVSSMRLRSISGGISVGSPAAANRAASSAGQSAGASERAAAIRASSQQPIATASPCEILYPESASTA